jgi:hypothetical protein
MTKDELNLTLEALEKYANAFGASDLSVKAMSIVRDSLAYSGARPAVFWEGLSADEISDLIPSTDLSGDYGYGDMFAVARLVEYKLKEKNEKKN